MHEAHALGQVSLTSVTRTDARSTRLKMDMCILVRNPIVFWTGLGGLRSPEAYLPALCPGASWNYN